MTTKFEDKLAQQALKHALETHTEVTQRNTEIQGQIPTLTLEVRGLEQQIEELRKIIEKNTVPSGTHISVDEIEQLIISREAQLEELEASHVEKDRRLKLYKAAMLRIQPEIRQAETQLKQARSTLAASFERYILESSEVSDVLALLRKAQAVWVAAAGNDFFNRKAWSEMLYAEPPCAEDLDYGREIMLKG